MWYELCIYTCSASTDCTLPNFSRVDLYYFWSSRIPPLGVFVLSGRCARVRLLVQDPAMGERGRLEKFAANTYAPLLAKKPFKGLVVVVFGAIFVSPQPRPRVVSNVGGIRGCAMLCTIRALALPEYCFGAYITTKSSSTCR